MQPELNYLRIASDLHLEHRLEEGRAQALLDKYLPPDERDSKSILVLAGDICSNWVFLAEFLKVCTVRFPRTLFVPGNHEYYGNDMQAWKAWSDNVVDQISTEGDPFIQLSIVNQTKIRGIYGGRILVYATTLWADGGKTPIEELVISRMNDFRCIRNGDKMFNVQDMKALNKAQGEALVEHVQLYKDRPSIVVTHHLPSHFLQDPRYSPSLYDGLFASNQDHILGASWAPKLWIFGHTHRHVSRMVGNTHCLANPLGYPGERSCEYDPFCFINLEDIQ